MRSQSPPLGPGVGFVVVIDIAQEQAARRFMDHQSNVRIDPHRPEVFVAHLIELMQA